LDDGPGSFSENGAGIVWRERCHKAQNGCISPHMAIQSSLSWYPARGAVFTNASVSRHRLVTHRSYSQRMNQLQSDLVPEIQIAPMYRVVLMLHGERTIEQRLERRVRDVIASKRGVLHGLAVDRAERASKMSLHLGARRIDDVVAALEGAGFEVSAVIATRAPVRPLAAVGSGPDASIAGRVRARSSNLYPTPRTVTISSG